MCYARSVMQDLRCAGADKQVYFNYGRWNYQEDDMHKIITQNQT